MRDALPQLKEGVKLYLISIGPGPRCISTSPNPTLPAHEYTAQLELYDSILFYSLIIQLMFILFCYHSIDATVFLHLRGKEFCQLTGLPEEHMIADPEAVAYDTAGFKKGVLATFFNPQVASWIELPSSRIPSVTRKSNSRLAYILGRLRHVDHPDLRGVIKKLYMFIFFMSLQTPLAIFKRLSKDGAKTLKETLGECDPTLQKGSFGCIFEWH